MSTAANRYAKALLDLAISDGSIDGYQSELEAVTQIFQIEKDLNAFLLSPQKDLKVKKSVLSCVFQASVKKNILHLLLLLLDKGRFELLPEISSAYQSMADKYLKILNITVTTAFPLDEAQANHICERLKAVHHGSSVKLTVATDRSLIGGVKIAIGDRLYDGTVKGKLAKMKSAISGQ